jgi:two-component system cell cycle sensor histidine kinase/response regulator CckA
MATTTLLAMDAELLSRIHDLVHVGTWIWDVQADTIEWSDELHRIFEAEPGSLDLTLETFIGFVHPDDRVRVSAVIQDAMAARSSFQFDHRIVTAKGAVRMLHGRGFVQVDARGEITMLVGTGMDITEQARHQSALRESEERFRSVFEQSSVGIAITDAEKRFVSANVSFAELLGLKPRELIGKTILEVTHPDDVDRSASLLQQLDTRSGSFTYEKRYLKADGATVWGRTSVTRLRRDDGSLNGYIGVVEDITAQKQAADILARQKEVLQTVMDHLPVMISMFGASGRPVYLNREWQRTFGWTLEEARSMHIIDVMYPDGEERGRARTAIANGQARWMDFEPVSRDGKAIPSSWACINLSDGTHLTIGQDTTERRALEQRLIQSQRMEALGQLAGGVAHDFNNILTVISACASFVQDAVKDQPAVLDDVKEIQNASKRAEALTRQLLAFSRRQMLRPEIVDVNAAVQALSKTLNRLIPESIQLAMVTNAVTPTIRVDVHQLEQVLLNLVVNSRDAIRETGTITIETANAVKDLPNQPQTACVVISVSDDGAGIPPAVRHRIFEPFFTTKSVGHGTGLGLATVLGIVEQSGGFVDVDSTVGVGTTFHIHLPAITACAVEILRQDSVQDCRGSETVLLVEDEASVRAIARRVLVDAGYTVLEARHGADGLRVSDTYVGPIHLLITDVVMPETGGRELARVLRTRRPGIPILYISGYTDDELLRRGILETGADVLRKPFVPTELKCVVKMLINQGQGGAIAKHRRR